MEPWNMTQSALRKIITKLAASQGYHIGILPPVTDSYQGHLSLLFERYDINLLVDVGANRGQFGQTVRRSGYEGRLISFEPDPETAAALTNTAASDPMWTVHAMALGETDSEAEFHRFGPDDLNSLHRPVDTGRKVLTGKLQVVETITVPVRTLGSLWGEITEGIDDPVRCFLKLDTQGHDLKVFLGARDVLPNVTALQTELAWQPLYEDAPPAMEALQVFRQAGFAVSGCFTVNTDRQLRAVEMDCLMVKALR